MRQGVFKVENCVQKHSFPSIVRKIVMTTSRRPYDVHSLPKSTVKA